MAGNTRQTPRALPSNFPKLAYLSRSLVVRPLIKVHANEQTVVVVEKYQEGVKLYPTLLQPDYIRVVYVTKLLIRAIVTPQISCTKLKIPTSDICYLARARGIIRFMFVLQAVYLRCRAIGIFETVKGDKVTMFLSSSMKRILRRAVIRFQILLFSYNGFRVCTLILIVRLCWIFSYSILLMFLINLISTCHFS